MTALSTLVGGGGGGANAWPSNSPHLFMVPNNMYNTQSHANYDMLCSFVPPSDVTIDSVDWECISWHLLCGWHAFFGLRGR